MSINASQRLKPTTDARVTITSGGLGMPAHLVGTHGTVLEVGRLLLVVRMDMAPRGGPLDWHTCRHDQAEVVT